MVAHQYFENQSEPAGGGGAPTLPSPRGGGKSEPFRRGGGKPEPFRRVGGKCEPFRAVGGKSEQHAAKKALWARVARRGRRPHRRQWGGLGCPHGSPDRSRHGYRIG